MAAGDLITGDWQMEYAGLLLGDGTDYSIVRIEGLLDLPAVTTADKQLLRRHGLHPGDDFLAGRTVVATVEVYGSTEAEFDTNVQNLLTALRPGLDEQPLVFQIPGVAMGEKVRVGARHRKRAWTIDQPYYYRLSTIALEFVATDPRIYANTAGTGTTSLPSAGGGLNFNAVPNLTFGAVSTGGSINAVNAGTFATPVVFRIDGPATNPRIENLTTGKRVEFNISLAADEYLVVDTAARTVLLNGTASRYSTLVAGSSLFELEPGANEITFRAATTTVATLTASWRSAWV